MAYKFKQKTGNCYRKRRGLSIFFDGIVKSHVRKRREKVFPHSGLGVALWLLKMYYKRLCNLTTVTYPFPSTSIRSISLP